MHTAIFNVNAFICAISIDNDAKLVYDKSMRLKQTHQIADRHRRITMSQLYLRMAGHPIRDMKDKMNKFIADFWRRWRTAVEDGTEVPDTYDFGKEVERMDYEIWCAEEEQRIKANR